MEAKVDIESRILSSICSEAESDFKVGSCEEICPLRRSTGGRPSLGHYQQTVSCATVATFVWF